MFVFPMAGEGRRFREAGFTVPKYRLPLNGATVFDHVVGSFAAYFRDDVFLFIAPHEEAGFVEARRRALNIDRAHVVTLGQRTGGQADTVLSGLDLRGVAGGEPVGIFNIDTIRRGYAKPRPMMDPRCDGYLEVFRGEGVHWSFVEPEAGRPGMVASVVEKRPISEFCCTGFYYFRTAEDFRWAYANPAPPRSDSERRERYVAPLYNALIARGRQIAFDLIESRDVLFCGTPDEYRQAQAFYAPEDRVCP
ncbi:MAG: capsular biosynthesis protein [Alphaproteobacteria bacterium]|nr:capsular biosynthesis protein [Alphaproteobacteria bacterium]